MPKSIDTSSLANIISTGICPIITSLENLEAVAAHPTEVAQALSENGVTTLEIANRGRKFMSLIEQVIEPLARHGISVGIGTITKPRQVKRAVRIGAKYIVSPYFDKRVSRACKKKGILYIPGVETAKEFARAYRKGWHTVKFFPAQTPRKLQQICGALAFSCPDLSVIASGMEKPKEKQSLHRAIGKWYTAGAASIVYGYELFGNNVLPRKEWKTLSENARWLIQDIAHLRE